MLVIVSLALLALAGEPEAEDATWERDGWGWGALPALNYDTDDGFGYGLVGNLYRYNGKTAPYKTSIHSLVFMTTKRVHIHRLKVDALELAGGPLRLTTRAELNAVRTANFCGFGARVTCDPSVASEAADALGLEGDERDDFERRYYLMRYVRPNGFVNARWMLRDAPSKIELMFGWRGDLLMPGDFAIRGPYEGSLYDETFPGGGEWGLLSILQAGVMWDSRDNEPAPRRGTWTEVSVRGSTIAWGSAWTHVAGNTTLRGYLPLAPEGRLTFANRLILDAMLGDAPFTELGQVGGSTVIEVYGGGGGGRGIRAQRYIGRIKAIETPELRWWFGRLDLGPAFDFTLVAFADIGWVAEDWTKLRQLAALPHVGTGGGLRIAMDDNFVVRVDTGFSSVEDWSPGIYIDIGNLF